MFPDKDLEAIASGNPPTLPDLPQNTVINPVRMLASELLAARKALRSMISVEDGPWLTHEQRAPIEACLPEHQEVGRE